MDVFVSVSTNEIATMQTVSMERLNQAFFPVQWFYDINFPVSYEDEFR